MKQDIIVRSVGVPALGGLDFLARYLRGRLDAEKRPELKIYPKCDGAVKDVAKAE